MSKTFALPILGPVISSNHSHTKPVVKDRPVSRPSNVSYRPHSVRPVSRRQSVWRRARLAVSALGASSQARMWTAYTLAIILVAAGASHVFLINSSAAKGYEIRKIQTKIQKQNEALHRLEVKTAELSSLGAINQAAATANLVSVKNEEFLAPSQITALQSK